MPVKPLRQPITDLPTWKYKLKKENTQSHNIINPVDELA